MLLFWIDAWKRVFYRVYNFPVSFIVKTIYKGTFSKALSCSTYRQLVLNFS